MVSKSKILGKSTVVFVTVGTSSFPFTRLFKTVDQIMLTMPKKPLLIAQIGCTEYKWRYKNIKTYKYLSPPKMIRIIENAEKIISHGGFGTIYMIARYSKYIPLVVARQKRFNEHVDDHQKYFLDYLSNSLSEKEQINFVHKTNLTKNLAVYLKKLPKKSHLNNIFSSKSVIAIEKKLNKYIGRHENTTYS